MILIERVKSEFPTLSLLQLDPVAITEFFVYLYILAAKAVKTTISITTIIAIYHGYHIHPSY